MNTEQYLAMLQKMAERQKMRQQQMEQPRGHIYKAKASEDGCND